MSVLTTPRTTPASPAPPARAAARYSTLTPREQDIYQRAMAAADAATNVWHIKDIHAFASAALGIHLPTGAELAMCECGPCPDDCDLITDRAAMAEYLDDTGMQRLQCGPCTSDHRHTGDH